MALHFTCLIRYNKHHINKIGLHNTKYQTVTKLGKQNSVVAVGFTCCQVTHNRRHEEACNMTVKNKWVKYTGWSVGYACVTELFEVVCCVNLGGVLHVSDCQVLKWRFVFQQWAVFLFAVEVTNPPTVGTWKNFGSVDSLCVRVNCTAPSAANISLWTIVLGVLRWPTCVTWSWW